MSLLLPLLVLLHAAPPPPLLATAIIEGRVVSIDGAPLAEARVLLVDGARQAETDADGRFTLARLRPGTWELVIARVGYRPARRTVLLPSGGRVQLEVVLEASPLELPPLQVTGTGQAADPAATAQATAALTGGALLEATRASLGETLERLPGVANNSMGAGIGRPVIRGLSGNRVVTVDNGQRVESQTWGADHAPNVEVLDAARLEVVKGPASVLYGSDALGGVVQVVPDPVPDALGRAAWSGGRLTTAYDANMRMPEGALQLEGGVRGLGARLSVTGREGDDLRTPSGPLRNSAVRARHLRGAVGVRGAWGDAALHVLRRAERLGISEDPAEDPAYTGYQLLGTTRLLADVTLVGAAGRLQVQAGFERNSRHEFDAASAPAITLGLRQETWSGTVRAHHRPLGRFRGTVGAQLLRAGFRNVGLETLIPDSRTTDVAVFGFEQVQAGAVSLTGGVRADHRSLVAEPTAALALPRSTREFGAVTGSLGAVWQATELVAVAVAAGRGFRAPSTFDLFANGFHEGSRAWERGLPAAVTERALSVDAGLRLTGRRVEGELTAWRNGIAGYLYGAPIGPPGRVYDSLQTVQGDARLEGVEARLRWRPAGWLAVGIAGDAMRGTNTSTGAPLPWMPPPRVWWDVRAERAGVLGLERGWVLAAGQHWAAATRHDPREVPLPGYGLLELGAGGIVPVGGRPLQLDVAVRNVLDARYRPFLSRYKEFADGPGRTLVLRVTTAW
ncbi:MAG: TonB-dependent receptor [Gemmatimonadales bacterium]|nr:TonB-dependent receptor [Gemmatimonadales bacterium]